MTEYTKGELHLVSETKYDHIIYLRDEPKRRDKIIARFVNKADALLFLSSADMYEALKKLMLDGNRQDLHPIVIQIIEQALAKVDNPPAL